MLTNPCENEGYFGHSKRGWVAWSKWSMNSSYVRVSSVVFPVVFYLVQYLLRSRECNVEMSSGNFIS